MAQDGRKVHYLCTGYYVVLQAGAQHHVIARLATCTRHAHVVEVGDGQMPGEAAQLLVVLYVTQLLQDVGVPGVEAKGQGASQLAQQQV